MAEQWATLDTHYARYDDRGRLVSPGRVTPQRFDSMKECYDECRDYETDVDIGMDDDEDGLERAARLSDPARWRFVPVQLMAEGDE